MADLTNRQALQLALGVPHEETDTETVLNIALATLKAEAEVLLSEDSTVGEEARIQLEYAHRHRIEALRLLLDGHLKVSWAEAAQ